MDFLLAFCAGYDFYCALNYFGKKDWGWGLVYLAASILCGVTYFT